jgi:two-component system, response regulator PdtaR
VLGVLRPADRGAVAGRGTMNADREPGPVGNEEAAPRILVVEDDFLLRLSIARALRKNSAVVAEAVNADEAWRYLAAGFPVDLVFTDNQMPGSMTGVELAGRIRAEFSHIDVVVASGDGRGVSSSEPILRKPYRLAETAAELVRRALGARRKA